MAGLMVCTLRFASIDGSDGKLNLVINNLAILGKDIQEVVQRANDTLGEISTINHIPVMPQLIDPEGKIRWICVSDNAIGRSVKEILRAVKALQSGDLCPVEWAPGQKTLGKK